MNTVVLIHVHDHIWRSDWPADVTRIACQIIWNVIAQVDPLKGIEWKPRQ